jgi:hypothetical protein
VAWYQSGVEAVAAAAAVAEIAGQAADAHTTASVAGMELAQTVAEPSGKWECLHNPADCILPVAVPVVEGPFGLADSHHQKCVVLGVGSQTVRDYK